MMFSNGKWNYVLHVGSGKRNVRAVRADGRTMHRDRPDDERARRSRAA